MDETVQPHSCPRAHPLHTQISQVAAVQTLEESQPPHPYPVHSRALHTATECMEDSNEDELPVIIDSHRHILRMTANDHEPSRSRSWHSYCSSFLQHVEPFHDVPHSSQQRHNHEGSHHDEQYMCHQVFIPPQKCAANINVRVQSGAGLHVQRIHGNEDANWYTADGRQGQGYNPQQ
jgi:hypothetical protein